MEQKQQMGILSLLNSKQQSEQDPDHDPGGLPEKQANSFSTTLETSFQLESLAELQEKISSCIICNRPPSVDPDSGSVNMVDVNTDFYAYPGDRPVTIASFLAEILWLDRLADSQRLICVDCCEIVQFVEKLEAQLEEHKDIIRRKYENTCGHKILLPDDLQAQNNNSGTDRRTSCARCALCRCQRKRAALITEDGSGGAQGLSPSPLPSPNYPSADTALPELKVPPLNLFDTSECPDIDPLRMDESPSKLNHRKQFVDVGDSLPVRVLASQDPSSNNASSSVVEETRLTSIFTVDEKMLIMEDCSPLVGAIKSEPISVADLEPTTLVIEAVKDSSSRVSPTKKNQFICEICDQKFLRPAQLATHHKKVHKKSSNKVPEAKEMETPTSVSAAAGSRLKAISLSDKRILSPRRRRGSEPTTGRAAAAADCNSKENKRTTVNNSMVNDNKRLKADGKTSTVERGSKADKDMHLCVECGITFVSWQTLKFHKSTHTGEFSYHCPDCGKGFNNYSLLEEHQHTHTGDRPYGCDDCSQTFANRGSLWVHKKRHKVDKPYPCEFCQKSFNHASHLVVHRRIHTGETPYHCRLCPAGFISDNYLKRHMRMNHDNELPFGCGVCKMAFAQRKQLIKHGMLEHEGKVVDDVADDTPQPDESRKDSKKNKSGRAEPAGTLNSDPRPSPVALFDGKVVTLVDRNARMPSSNSSSLGQTTDLVKGQSSVDTVQVGLLQSNDAKMVPLQGDIDAGEDILVVEAVDGHSPSAAESVQSLPHQLEPEEQEQLLLTFYVDKN